jgi:hypothetical protein
MSKDKTAIRPMRRTEVVFSGFNKIIIKDRIIKTAFGKKNQSKKLSSGLFLCTIKNAIKISPAYNK